MQKHFCDVTNKNIFDIVIRCKVILSFMGHSTESGNFFIFQIQKNKTVIGTSLLNSKHSNNIKESEKTCTSKSSTITCHNIL